VYDKNVNFYKSIDEDIANAPSAKEKEEAMTLKQYHTKNLLEGKFDGEDEDTPPKSYAQEREEDRQETLKQIKAEADSGDEEDDFLVAKPKPAASEKRAKITEQDVMNADKDPETFLSNFMASRAWVPTGESHWAPLESDDEDEDARADEYETAYNMYFETTEGANEKIVTYARDAVANTTVRREEKSGRRKAREVARAKREMERQEKEEGLARLRKLKIEDMEGKVNQIRKIGGLKGRDFKMEDWADVLEADWSDDQWDEEMRKRFGDAYYDGGDDVESDEDAENSKGKKKKPKKPKFDDDIDIKDLIPDFDDEENEKPAFTLSSDEEDDAVPGAEEDEEEDVAQPSSKKTSKQRKQERADAKSAARRDRRLIENLVDSTLEYEAAMAANSKGPTGFRYRETSPTTFGLTARDILLADDSRLNDFAGLKKLATFRDPVKKKKDKKALSKKARLRAWRQETFGDEDGPKGGFAENATTIAAPGDELNEDAEIDIREGDGKKKKKRNRKRKTAAAEA
jgi:protein KRI1